MNPSYKTSTSQTVRWPWRRVAVYVVLFGMLIWVRLRLVTDMPRTVMADPDRSALAEPEGPHDGPALPQTGPAAPVRE